MEINGSSNVRNCLLKALTPSQLFLFDVFSLSRALLLLKKKRFQEQLLQRTDGQLDNLEKMVSELEFSQIQAKVVEGLKIGNESLKKMHEVIAVFYFDATLNPPILTPKQQLTLSLWGGNPCRWVGL